MVLHAVKTACLITDGHIGAVVAVSHQLKSFRGATYRIVEVGYLHPKGMEATDALGAGEVGYFTASIKNVSDTKVGDTVTAVSATEVCRTYGFKLCSYEEGRELIQYFGLEAQCCRSDGFTKLQNGRGAVPRRQIRTRTQPRSPKLPHRNRGRRLPFGQEQQTSSGL